MLNNIANLTQEEKKQYHLALMACNPNIRFGIRGIDDGHGEYLWSAILLSENYYKSLREHSNDDNLQIYALGTTTHVNNELKIKDTEFHGLQAMHYRVAQYACQTLFKGLIQEFDESEISDIAEPFDDGDSQYGYYAKFADRYSLFAVGHLRRE